MTFEEWFQKREMKGYTQDIEAAWNASRKEASDKLAIAIEALEKISKQYGEGYNITYPTASTKTATEALEKLKS